MKPGDLVRMKPGDLVRIRDWPVFANRVGVIVRRVRRSRTMKAAVLVDGSVHLFYFDYLEPINETR